MKIFLILIIIDLFEKVIEISNNTESRDQSIYDGTIDKISEKINYFIKQFELSKTIDENEKNEQKETMECLSIMNDSYLGAQKYSYLTKLFYDSSPVYDDIKNYYNCYNNLYINVDNSILGNLTYIVIKYKDIIEKNETEYETAFNSFSKVFGACVPQGCSHKSYFNIVKFINKNYFLIDGNIIDVINLRPINKFSLTQIIFQSIIPFLMIIFILLIIGIKYISSLFWSLFGYFFKICNKKKYDKEMIEKILKKNKSIQINTLNSFINISSNIEEVTPGSKESQISNEDGLQIILGLRGIFIIGLFFGLTLQNIFTTPTRIFDDIIYMDYMKTKLYAFLFFFARISQKMLYAISGFELTFKLLFYFDNKLYKKYVSSVQSIDLNTMNLNKYVVESSSNTNSVVYSPKSGSKNTKTKDPNNLDNSAKKFPSTSSKISKNKNSTKSKRLKSFTSSKSINEEEEESEEFEDEESDSSDEDEKKIKLFYKKRKKENISRTNPIPLKKFVSSIEKGKIYLKNFDKLSFQTLLSFHLRQSYLYFIFVFSILYFVFWQTQIFAYVYQYGSLWMMITSEIEEYFDKKIILSTIFLYSGTCSYLRNYYNFFIPAMNEIFFYLFGSTIIYICYKKNSRLDKYLIIIICIVIFAKILVYAILNKEMSYHPSFDFMQYGNHYLNQMHLLNLSYYCIGMLVGLANYSLQNDSKKKNIVKEFVKLPRKLFYVIKRTYNFIFGLSLFIIFLFCDIFLYKIYLALNKKYKADKNNDVQYFKSIFINIFNLIDCEIIIFCIFILTIIVFYSSYSFLRDNFKSYIWKILSRIYFPLLLISQMQSNWFLFHFAERIDLNIEGVLYVFTLIFILSIVVSIAIYVFFQVPLKKLTMIIFIEKNKIIDELNYLNNKERTNSMSVSENENSSIDLNANATKFYINGRKMSEVMNEENDVIKNDLEIDLVYDNNDNPFNGK